MRTAIFISLLIILNINTTMAQSKLETVEQKASYSLGISIANYLIKDNLTNLDTDLILAGLKDKIAGDLQMDEAEAGIALQNYFDQMMANKGNLNLEKGKKFLAENSKKEGITVLPSGLQYEILKEGSGASPAATSTVTTHYEGTLISGDVFDSSYRRGEPASFPVNGVIAGWTEALQLMKPGGKWKLYIPAELAYGANGAGGTIGPNETLIFIVELLEIK